MRIERNWQVVLVKRLIPTDVELVAVEHVAELAGCKRCCVDGRALYLTDCVEVVAVVEGGRAAAEGVAIICACAFGEFTCCVAVVQDGGRGICSECHEAAVHRTTSVAHLAEGSAIVEGNCAIHIASHTAVACYARAVAGDVDVRHNILYEYIARVITCKRAIVDAFY